MPVSALANAGVVIDIDWMTNASCPIFFGVFVGLLLGKFIGIFGFSMLGLKLKMYKMPENLNIRSLIGISFLSAIVFTLSLFITSLAFTTPEMIEQAKLGILMASGVAGLLGFFILKNAIQQQPKAG
jgi:NhaA family Na+:H+ antiporter